jgi:ectoine hydroxylase-related dioxygenase (phytanoyl-CoA dioxygenase family)
VALCEHLRVVELLDALLLPNWLLSTCQSIRLHPGETAQPWHTDDGFYPVPRPRTRLAISTIWAIEAFTRDNGATQVIPGSHRWASEHPDERAHEVVDVVMPAGSVVVFDAALWHRGGGNRSSSTRLALSPQYCQPWLRPQESQLLIVPPDRARALSPRARAMLGYSIHPPFIGQVEGMNPIRLVDPTHQTGNRAALHREALVADEMLRRPRS